MRRIVMIVLMRTMNQKCGAPMGNVPDRLKNSNNRAFFTMHIVPPYNAPHTSRDRANIWVSFS